MKLTTHWTSATKKKKTKNFYLPVDNTHPAECQKRLPLLHRSSMCHRLPYMAIWLPLVVWPFGDSSPLMLLLFSPSYWTIKPQAWLPPRTTHFLFFFYSFSPYFGALIHWRPQRMPHYPMNSVKVRHTVWGVEVTESEEDQESSNLWACLTNI